jgi:hypothetical protein
MDIAYEWKLTGPWTEEEGSIKTFWKKSGTDSNGTTADYPGMLVLTGVHLEAQGIVDFSTLSDSEILDCIKLMVGVEYEKYIDKEIEKKIIELRNQQ